MITCVFLSHKLQADGVDGLSQLDWLISKHVLWANSEDSDEMAQNDSSFSCYAVTWEQFSENQPQILNSVDIDIFLFIFSFF